MTDVRSASATDVGAQRAVNQDRVYNVAPLFAVADGMGGHVGGEVAAHTAIEALAAAFSAPDAPVSLVALVEAMRKYLRVLRSSGDICRRRSGCLEVQHRRPDCDLVPVK